ncbi:MAG TPA: 3-hydroxyacyl-CoA dehydrogenase family protein [Flavitalea sp.]|nr:3-hydroxyacyl-CoA dehydrogenase family protein [Flavitalea sp.]
MHVAVLADDTLKKEFLSKNIPQNIRLTFADSLRSLEIIEADAYFDLSGDLDRERMKKWSLFQGRILIVNAVPLTRHEIKIPVIRINAWPTFLSRPLIEIAVTAEGQGKYADKVFHSLQWTYQVVPDIAGFIGARMVAAIINEAYFTLGDQVSSKEDIDIAMKLGTNYPYGPFEWSEKIGLRRVAELLQQLALSDKLYRPAPAMELELWAARSK